MPQEIYSNTSRKRYISVKELKILKDNMAKAPVIHTKAEDYHKKESNDADLLLKKLHSTDI